jgi:hypothetical protein
MADGCDGLRQMAGAYAADDREAFDEGTRESGAFDPAGDDIPGGKDAHQDLRAAWGARDALLLAAYVPPESVNGKEIWRHQSLDESQQQQINEGLAVCENY